MQGTPVLDELRGHGEPSWVHHDQGWLGAAEEIIEALSKDGFAECKRETTSSRRDTSPAGGIWQGVNAQTGSVAAAIWVNRVNSAQAVVFITIDGVPITGGAR